MGAQDQCSPLAPAEPSVPDVFIVIVPTDVWQRQGLLKITLRLSAARLLEFGHRLI